MKNYIRTIASGVLLFCTLLSTAGEIQPITGLIRNSAGTTVTVGQPSAEVEIQQTPLPATCNCADYNVVDLISLNLDHASPYFFSTPTEVSVDLTIKRWDGTGVAMADETTTLKINSDSRYDQKTVDRSILRLTNGYKVKVIVDEIYVNGVVDRKSTRLNSSHIQKSRMPSSA